MIGGTDIVIKTIYSNEIADQLLKLAIEKWPNLVLEDANTGETIAYSIPNILSLPNEFFVYLNAKAKQRWDEEGACDGLDNTMLHILISEEALTVVVDNPEAEINRKVVGAVQEFAHELQVFRYGVAA